MASRRWLLGLVLMIPALAGMSAGGETLYLFGPARSCYLGVTRTVVQCQTLRLTDTLQIATAPDSRQVHYHRVAVGLNARNTVDKTLDACNVVDEQNFTCSGFVREGGHVVKSTALGSPLITRSFWAYALSRYAGPDVDRQTVLYLDANDGWLSAALIAVVLIAAFAIVRLVAYLVHSRQAE